MMNRLHLRLLLTLTLTAFLSCAVPGFAQYTGVTGTTVQNGYGALLSSGTICFSPYNSFGMLTPIVPVGHPPTTGPFCATVTNGVFSEAAKVPDLATSAPAGLNYQITVYDSVGTSLLQVNWVTRVSGPTWDFSTLSVPISLNGLAAGSGVGVPYPNCDQGASFTRTDVTGAKSGWQCKINNGVTGWFQAGNQPPPGPGQTATIPVVVQMIKDAIGQGGGGGGAPVGPGAIQAGNFAQNGFVNSGLFNTDVYQTGGGNNGLANFQNSTACTSLSCSAFFPPSSIDGEAFTALPQKAGRPSSFVQYLAGSVMGLAHTNPRVINSQVSAFGQYQIARLNNVVFTEPNPGPIQGGFQMVEGNVHNWSAPGYSNGGADCPLFCPQTGKGGAGQWTVSLHDQLNLNFNTQGIRQTHNNAANFYGIGDCQGSGGFVTYMGGFVAPSDEGCYGWEHMHFWNAGEFVGNIATVTDINHIFVTPTAGGTTQGDGRFLLGNFVQSTEVHPLQQVSIINSSVPGAGTYGTMTFDTLNGTGQAVTIPASYARGRLAADCAVPVQDYGLAPANGGAGCIVTVIAGTFDTVSPVCLAYDRFNQFNIGIKVDSVTAPSGGTQTLHMSIRHPVPATGFVFQGGACSSVLSLDIDYLNDTGHGAVHGSAFPLIGSLSGNVVAYMNYNASQTWATVPNPGSLFRAANLTSGGVVTATNLNRVGGVVTSTLTSGFQGNPPPNWALQASGFFKVTGCADSTMNGFIPTNPATQLTTASTFTYLQAGADSTCSAATYVINVSTASLYWGAEIEDVANHAPNVPANAVVDGTMTTTWQPNWTVGTQVFSPPHYAASVLGLRNDLSYGTPAQQSHAFNCNLGGTSALMGQGNAGSCLLMQTDPVTNLEVLKGGTGVPSNGIRSEGAWKNWLAMRDAPMTNGSVLQIGRVLGNYVTHDWSSNFNIWTTGGDDHQTGLNFNEATQKYSMFFNYNLDSPAITYTLNQNTFNNPTAFRNSTFQNITSQPANFQISSNYSKLATCGMFQPSSGNYNVLFGTPVCYGAVIDGDLTIGQAGTPGATQYSYVLIVDDEAGPSSSNVTTTFTGATTLNGSNYNTISCSALPAGKTGTIYSFINPLLYPVGAVGNCPNPSTVVNDQGTYGTGRANHLWAAGKNFYSGGFGATGLTGSYLFTQADVFGDTNPAQTPTAGISQISEGNLSVDTTAHGNSLGTLKLAKVITPVIQGTGSGNFLQIGTNVFSALPACTSGIEGSHAPVTDSNTNTWGATVAGGGSNHVGAYCNGTNWTVYSK